ncbi:hypothetical protein IF2G_03800 [Cordyceps javanica]|nr:hypothetical protein IF2G_03800 [Cordyceps javanica]
MTASLGVSHDEKPVSDSLYMSLSVETLILALYSLEGKKLVGLQKKTDFYHIIPFLSLSLSPSSPSLQTINAPTTPPSPHMALYALYHVSLQNPTRDADCRDCPQQLNAALSL